MKVKSSKYSRNYAIFFIFLLLKLAGVNAQEAFEVRPSIKTIVIDAGHGGKDPGCHGASAQEKHVCLSMALMLGEMIQANYPDIKVIYTRNTDVFVELDERAHIANKNNADLFICIHANAATPSVAGVETYVLGLHKTEAQQQIAERENATIYLEEDKGAKYKDFDLTPDALIARQIQLSVFLNQSINYASKLQTQFKLLGRNDRGVKQAGFLVLYKTTMPSVLIETGFLTNLNEERFLSSIDNQKKMAYAMFTAFEEYRNDLEGINSKPITLEVAKTDQKIAEVKSVEVVKVEKKELSSEDAKTQKSKTNNPFQVDENLKKTSPPVAVDKKEVPIVIEKKETLQVAKQEVQIEEKKVVKEEIISKVIFRVQIETSTNALSLKDLQFKALEVYEYKQSGLFKYTVGVFENDFNTAVKYKNELTAKGFKGAFVVAFFNNERIVLEKAIKLAEK